MKLCSCFAIRRASTLLRVVVPAVGFLVSMAPTYAEEVLRIPYVSDIGTFDPDNGFEIGAMSAIDNVYEGLVEYAPESTKIVGLLAKNWEISDDGLTYTFHLVKDVKFHDGTPFDAAAVVTSFERRRDHKLILGYFLSNVQEMKATDDSTVVFKLGHPQPSLLDGLASAWGPKVISPRALSEHDKNDAAANWLNEHAVGTGPFKLAEFKRGERYVLERNDQYWGAKPYFDKIQISVVPDVSQQILQLQAGAIDAVPVDYPFSQLENLPSGLEITAIPSVIEYALFTKPGTPLDDPDIRKAFLTAINPNFWVKDAFGRFATTAKSPYPKVLLDPEHPIKFPTDLEAAKAAIAKHGEISLSIGLHLDEPSFHRVADLLIAQMATIGVKATAYVLPADAAYALKTNPNPPDVLLTIIGPDAAHPENQAKIFFTKEATLNFFGRSLPEADAIVDQAGLLTDIKKRDALYETAGRMWVDAGYVIPLVEVEDVVVHAKGLKDLGLRPVFPAGNIDFGTVRRAP